MPCSLTGANARLCVKPEVTWGAAPVGNYAQVPFITADFSEVDDLSGTDVLGYGRDAQRQGRDGYTVRGRMTVPLDRDAIGLWLRGFFGPGVDAGTTPNFTHVFSSGAVNPGSLALEFQHPDGSATPIFTSFSGVLVDTLGFSWGPTGRVQLDLGLIAISETEDNTSQAGTPTVAAPVWFDQRNVTITKDGAAVAKGSALTLTLANNWEAVKTIGSDGIVDCADPGMFAIDGSITLRDNTLAMQTLAKAATLFDLVAGWGIDVNTSLRLEVFKAELARTGRAIRGPGAIERTYRILGSHDFAATGVAVKATLANQTATY